MAEEIDMKGVTGMTGVTGTGDMIETGDIIKADKPSFAIRSTLSGSRTPTNTARTPRDC
jgi:hypothetical protein